eukprot:235370-Amphidinium_carterae.1
MTHQIWVECPPARVLRLVSNITELAAVVLGIHHALEEAGHSGEGTLEIGETTQTLRAHAIENGCSLIFRILSQTEDVRDVLNHSVTRLAGGDRASTRWRWRKHI